MKYLYGITADQYRTLYANQGGRCAICDTFEPVEFKMSVDHDHACCPGEKACGKCVRGLLCNRCNVLLGHAQDNPDHLRRAIAYLGGQ